MNFLKDYHKLVTSSSDLCILCRLIKNCLAKSYEKVEIGVSKLNNGKSSLMVTAILKYGSQNLMQHLTCLLQKVRSVEYVPQDLKDTLILVIFKGKSSRYDYRSYYRISLLSVIGKVLCKIFERLFTHLADEVLSESVWF